MFFETSGPAARGSTKNTVLKRGYSGLPAPYPRHISAPTVFVFSDVKLKCLSISRTEKCQKSLQFTVRVLFAVIHFHMKIRFRLKAVKGFPQHEHIYWSIRELRTPKTRETYFGTSLSFTPPIFPSLSFFELFSSPNTSVPKPTEYTSGRSLRAHLSINICLVLCIGTARDRCHTMGNDIA